MEKFHAQVAYMLKFKLSKGVLNLIQELWRTLPTITSSGPFSSYQILTELEWKAQSAKQNGIPNYIQIRCYKQFPPAVIVAVMLIMRPESMSRVGKEACKIKQRER